MKPSSRILVEDVRLGLHRLCATGAQDNPLLTGFIGWLLPERFGKEQVKRAADEALLVRGAARSARSAAVLGFACALPDLHTDYSEAFKEQLEWLMGRPNYAVGGEPSGVVADPVNLFGVVLGGKSVLRGETLQKFDKWAAQVASDALKSIGDSGWQSDLVRVVEARISGTPITSLSSGAWFRAAFSPNGWTSIEDNHAERVLIEATDISVSTSDGFEAAMKLKGLEWALGRAMDFNLEAMSVRDVGLVLNNVSSVFQRWTWELAPRGSAARSTERKWHIDNEYHVQSLLYVVLKPILPALKEEEYLPSTGNYQPRADLCLLPLSLVIEVKYWRKGIKGNKMIEEIAADVTLYLKDESPYRHIVAVIWDDASRTQEHDEMIRGLKGLNGMSNVVILSRPSNWT